MEAGQDVSRVASLTHQGSHLRLREDRAGVADGHRFSALQGERADLFQRDLQDICHQLEEAPGAGSTLVVHGEVTQASLLVAADRLAVLATHVEHGADPGEQTVGATSVAGQLRHLLIGERNDDAPVAGSDHVADVVQLETRPTQGDAHDALRGADRFGTGRHDGVLEDAVLFENQGLGAGRANVHAGDVQSFSIPIRGRATVSAPLARLYGRVPGVSSQQNPSGPLTGP